MKRKIIILLAACVAAAPLQDQNLEFGGLTYNNDLMMSTDFAALSRSHPFGTARVMGMGGAFTSLGADLSSMSINPAGLGMYRRNEFSLTPLPTAVWRSMFSRVRPARSRALRSVSA